MQSWLQQHNQACLFARLQHRCQKGQMERKGHPAGPGIHCYRDAHDPLPRSVYPVYPVKHRWDDGTEARPSGSGSSQPLGRTNLMVQPSGGKTFHFQLVFSELRRKHPDVMSHRVSVLFHLWQDFHGNERLRGARLASESVRSSCVQLPDGFGTPRLTLQLRDSDIISVVVRALNYTQSH